MIKILRKNIRKRHFWKAGIVGFLEERPGLLGLLGVTRCAGDLAQIAQLGAAEAISKGTAPGRPCDNCNVSHHLLIVQMICFCYRRVVQTQLLSTKTSRRMVFRASVFLFFSGGAESQSTADHGICSVFWRSKTKIVIQICVLPMRFAFFLCFHMVFTMFCVSWLQNGGPPRTSSFWGRVHFAIAKSKKNSALRLTSHFSGWSSKWTQSVCCDPRKVGSEDQAA